MRLQDFEISTIKSAASHIFGNDSKVVLFGSRVYDDVKGGDIDLRRCKEECISLVTRLLRRKFGIQFELEQLLAQLQTVPVEKLEDLTEAIFDLDA